MQEIKHGVTKGSTEKMGLPLGMANVGKFSDGETAININEVVRIDVYNTVYLPHQVTTLLNY